MVVVRVYRVIPVRGLVPVNAYLRDAGSVKRIVLVVSSTVDKCLAAEHAVRYISVSNEKKMMSAIGDGDTFVEGHHDRSQKNEQREGASRNPHIASLTTRTGRWCVSHRNGEIDVGGKAVGMNAADIDRTCFASQQR